MGDFERESHSYVNGLWLAIEDCDYTDVVTTFAARCGLSTVCSAWSRLHRRLIQPDGYAARKAPSPSAGHSSPGEQ